MRLRSVAATASLLVVALASAACSSSGAQTASAPSASEAASDAVTPAPSASPTERWPGLAIGAEREPTWAPGSTGFAFDIGGAVVVTGTTGLPNGHLLDLTIDRRASDRLAAPILTAADGTASMLTKQGLVPLRPGQSLPLSDGWSLALGDGTATVIDQDAEALHTMTVPMDELWISATGTVVGNFDGVAFDIEGGALIENFPPVCRIADRHTVDDPLLVCDWGGTLVDGEVVEGEAPRGVPADAHGAQRWGWVTVGATGGEYLAALHDPSGSVLALGSREEFEKIEVVVRNGTPLFFRSSGGAWAFDYDAGALLQVADDGTTEVIREMPGVLDAMILLR